MSSFVIQDSFDTARLVAFYRALATEQPEPHFRDPYARRLAGERGEMLVQALHNGTPDIWAIIVRTCFYDEQILRLVKQGEIDTVINLAAGLDTRPYRLPLPGSLRWIEVDHADVLSYKKELLAGEQPACFLERVPFDLTDQKLRTAFLARVCTQTRKVLILTEGFLAYLTTEQVNALIDDLLAQPSIGWWLTEFTSPSILQHDEKHWNPIAVDCARTRFAPPGGAEFFRLHGWHIAEFRPPLEAALHLKLPLRLSWFLRLLIRLSSFLTKHTQQTNDTLGGFVLLKRDD